MAEIQIEVQDYLVSADVEWECVGHNGIGSYEYWGSTHFDKGKPTYEIQSINITCVFDGDGNEIPISELTKEQIALFKSWIKEKAEPETEE